MSFKDRFSHAAQVTKWKADQQMRILKAQNRINDLEVKIRTEKSKLGEAVFVLFVNGNLKNEELSDSCSQIDQIYTEIKMIQQEIEEAKSERAPELEISSTSVAAPQIIHPQEVNPQDWSGLVCPQCGRKLAGRFCPVHGIEGITPTSDVLESGILVCPVCGQSISGRYCPLHGVEGVIKTEEEKTDQNPPQSSLMENDISSENSE